ncbi:MAG: phosphatidylinositol-specific phospholipase C [Clostridia bacterium]|nr:phosphatidylinositol-specific phospholipase C [Clostridia bacterium]
MMTKRILRTLFGLTFLLLFPTLLIYADGSTTLSADGNAPAAWLSARAGDAPYTHDLRVVLAIPAETDDHTVTVTLSFEGSAAPEAVSTTLAELPLYRTVKAGGTTYTATENTALRILTVEELSDGSYTSVSLKLEKDGKTIHQAVQTAQNLGETADLTLIPWDGSLTDWMGALPDARSLAELTIPGTHDSGADDNTPFVSLFSKCQDLSIADQLTSGVRFLDIRLKLQSGKLNVYHGAANQYLTFDEVRSDCKAFLAAHPDEVILMSIKQEDDNSADFPAAIAAAINEDPGLWFTANRIPTLGETRGKIVLVRRYGGASIGINCADGWADNDNSNMNNGVSVKVQDYYDLGSTSNLTAKWDRIVALSTEAAKTEKSFYINFTSGTANLLITTVSNNINPKLLEYFATLPQGGYGTYPIDFITPEIASALIATNFPG